MSARKPLLKAPASNPRQEIKELGYIESRDEVERKDYAFLAYKEENPRTGKWVIRIKAKGARQLVLDPFARQLRSKISKAAVEGKVKYCILGDQIKPSDQDLRMLETRLYFNRKNLRPGQCEVTVRTRDANGKAKKPVALKFPFIGDKEPLPEVPPPLAPPKDSKMATHEVVGSVRQYDVVSDKDYEMLAFYLTNTRNGKRELRIQGRGVVSARLDPSARNFQKNIEDAYKQKQMFVKFGPKVDPKPSDPRLVECRLNFNQKLVPKNVELRIAVRDADGKQRKATVAKFPWSFGGKEGGGGAGAGAAPEAKQLVKPPNNTPASPVEYKQLGYIASRDNIASKDYAFVIFTDTNKRTGKVNIRVAAKGARSFVIDPDAKRLRTSISKAAVENKVKYCLVGDQIRPSDQDVRMLESRVYFDRKSLQPTQFEVVVRTRDANGKAKKQESFKCDWPVSKQAGSAKQLVNPPTTSNPNLKINQNAYLCQYDVIADKDYALCAYTEWNLRASKWSIRVAAKGVPSSRLDISNRQFQKSMEEAYKEKKLYVCFGPQLTPTDADKRLLEQRVYFTKELKPTSVEIRLAVRKANGSQHKLETAKFPLPKGDKPPAKPADKPEAKKPARI